MAGSVYFNDGCGLSVRNRKKECVIPTSDIREDSVLFALGHYYFLCQWRDEATVKNVWKERFYLLIHTQSLL